MTALSAVIPKERLTVGLAGGFLQITTGSLEHRIIGEKIPALRSVEEDSIAFAIKVKTVTAAGGGIRGLKLSRPPAASGPYLTRLNRKEQVEAGRLTDGERAGGDLQPACGPVPEQPPVIGELLGGDGGRRGERPPAGRLALPWI